MKLSLVVGKHTFLSRGSDNPIILLQLIDSSISDMAEQGELSELEIDIADRAIEQMWDEFLPY